MGHQQVTSSKMESEAWQMRKCAQIVRYRCNPVQKPLYLFRRDSGKSHFPSASTSAHNVIWFNSTRKADAREKVATANLSDWKMPIPHIVLGGDPALQEGKVSDARLWDFEPGDESETGSVIVHIQSVLGDIGPEG
jgi:hypothetical protein